MQDIVLSGLRALVRRRGRGSGQEHRAALQFVWSGEPSDCQAKLVGAPSPRCVLSVPQERGSRPASPISRHQRAPWALSSLTMATQSEIGRLAPANLND